MKKEKQPNLLLNFVIAMVIVGVGWYGVKSCATYKPPFDTKLSAYTTATMAVKSRLKAPSTAVFQSSMYANITNIGDKYTVSSYVDSQNSFGATLRSNFVVKLRLDGEQFEVLDIKIENE